MASGGRGVDDGGRGGAGLMHADQGDVRGFGGGGIGEGENSELANGAFGLDAHGDVEDALSGAVGVHAIGGVKVLKNNGFVVECGRGRGRRRRVSCRSLDGGLRQGKAG